MENQINRLSIVIPCFNESEVIPLLMPRVVKSLEQLRQRGQINDFEISVVNDQSTDFSHQLLKKYDSIKIINTKDMKRGYGNALKAGFAQATGDWIGFFDMDNTYRPEDLELFVKEIQKGEADFFMGLRKYNQKGMSNTRGLGNWMYRVLTHFFYGAKLGDVCSGYRLFHRRHLQEILELPGEGLSFSIQLTLNMIMQKIRIQQIPISYDERLGYSKLSVIKDGFSFLKVILTLKLRRHNAFKHSRV